MQITLDSNSGIYQIRAYQAGQIQVNDQWVQHSIIVSPEQLVDPWTPQSLGELQVGHWAPVIELGPEIVLLGIGEHLRFPAPKLLVPLYEKHIGIEVMTTPAACRTYNALAAEGRRVAAALFVR